MYTLLQIRLKDGRNENFRYLYLPMKNNIEYDQTEIVNILSVLFSL